MLEVKERYMISSVWMMFVFLMGLEDLLWSLSPPRAAECTVSVLRTDVSLCLLQQFLFSGSCSALPGKCGIAPQSHHALRDAVNLMSLQ